MRLHPIGRGSTAEEHGYNFDLLLGWLADIRDHELERSETHPKYTSRARALSDLVDGLEALGDGVRFTVELRRHRRSGAVASKESGGDA